MSGSKNRAKRSLGVGHRNPAAIRQRNEMLAWMHSQPRQSKAELQADLAKAAKNAALLQQGGAAR